MLLTIMALVQTYYGSLPRERAKLYQACVETLLLRWQIHKDETESDMPDVLTQLGVKQEDLERLLWQIGWVAHEQTIQRNEDADITESEVMVIAKEVLGSYAKAEKFLRYTEERAHLLIGRGGVEEQVYGFPHRTIQEYLAACYLAADRRFGRRVKLLAADGDTWREVLLLAVGTLTYNSNNREKALDAIEKVLPTEIPDADDLAGWRQIWLAGEMLAVIGREAVERDEVGQELIPQVRQDLIELLQNGKLPVVQRMAAGDALARLGDTRLGVLDVRQMEMCYVPGGPFWMGDKNGDEDEKEHLNEGLQQGYWIGRFPVTQAHFRQFIEAGGYQNANFWLEAIRNENWREPGEVKDWFENDWRSGPYRFGEPFKLDNHPVVGVMWYEMAAFCRWINTLIDLPPGYRVQLPSEAEWEKAARGGLKLFTSRDQVPKLTLEQIVGQPHPEISGLLVDNPAAKRVYPWGDSAEKDRISPNLANYNESQIGSTSAAGCFPAGASPYGCEELSGNVWEWTRSQVKAYPYDPDDGRENAGTVIKYTRMVLRGGAYYVEKDRVRCASRHRGYPYYWYGYYGGFRIVLSPFNSDR